MSTATTPHEASRACARAGCQAKACKNAAYRYRKQLNLEHSRGQHRLRDATQTRAHMERLLAAEWSVAQIARAAGLAHSTLSDVLAGRTVVSSRTARAVLNIRIGPPNEPKPVDATGTVRRLRALVYIGHSLPKIAPHTGMSAAKLWQIAIGRFNEVSPQTAQAIARAYRDLSSIPGSSPKARGHARRQKWHGPMAWDDIDDPAAKPETGGRRKGGDTLREPVDATEVARLTRAGMTTAQIALQLRCHERTVVRARRRAEMAVAA